MTIDHTTAILIAGKLDEIRALVEPFTVAPPVVEPPLDPLSPPAVFVIPDVEVLAGERTAYVRVQLAEPVPRQLRATFSTSNGLLGLAGTAAQKWASYEKTTADLIFLPGETEKVVAVPLHRDLGLAGFKVGINHSVNNPPVAPASGSVIQVAAREPIARRLQPTFAATDPHVGRSLVYRTDFLDLTGWDKKGGFYQSANKEAALYCDAALHPGFDPHPIEPVDGEARRILRMVRQDVTVMLDGRSQTFRYRAPMLNSRQAFMLRAGDHIELDAIIPVNTGGVPAFWGVVGAPYAEIDIFEFGLGGKSVMSATIHYADDLGGIPMEGVATTHVPDGRWHRYGFTWDSEWFITRVDGVEVHRRPSMFDGREMPIILNNTTGGILRADPKWPIGKTEDIVLGEFRAYR